MSLSSETRAQFQSAPFTSAPTAVKFKQSERDEIHQLTQEFLRNNGRINKLGSGKDLIAYPEVAPDFEPPKRAPKKVQPINSPITLIPYKNRALNKSKHGQNIRANKAETLFWVQIGSVELGRGENWTMDHAVEIRDTFRAASGMPPADY